MSSWEEMITTRAAQPMATGDWRLDFVLDAQHKHYPQQCRRVIQGYATPVWRCQPGVVPAILLPLR